jgi:predicted Rossmann-fold nucleotide-binding protein
MAICPCERPLARPSRSLVIVAGGGRDLTWPHPRVATQLLLAAGSRPVHRLLHGGARGADAAIARAAHQLGWPVSAHPADWSRHGRAAGPIRNRELLELALRHALAHRSPLAEVSLLVVAFPGGPGTASLVRHARRMAERAPLPIVVHQIQPPALLAPQELAVAA